MRGKRVTTWLIGVLAILGLAGVALAQVSPNFDIGWHILSGGGGSRESASFAVQDTLGQLASGSASSAAYQVEGGYWYQEALRTPTSTPTPSATPTPTGYPPDAYEPDDSCGAASIISTEGFAQTHSFHAQGDADWVKFTAVQGKTYVIRTSNTGDNVDTTLSLYDACDEAPLTSDDNAFGRESELQWDCLVSGVYYLKVQQHDPEVYGAGTNYDLSIAVDVTPPSPPQDLSAAPANGMLVLQWKQNSERDAAAYRVYFGGQPGTYGGVRDIEGAGTTYYELTGLENGRRYYLAATALDFSGNESTKSGEISGIPSADSDPTVPEVEITVPSSEATYTTSRVRLAIGGIGRDDGENLSRARVRNVTSGLEEWDYSLEGSEDTFSVSGLDLLMGTNQIRVTIYDLAGNSAEDVITINRVSGLGAAVILGGHSESYSLQSNIEYSTNRAFLAFLGAGLTKDDIYYLSANPQDADGDGANDVDATATGDNLRAAIQSWASSRVGPGIPFFLYMMDHGNVELFCTNGCRGGGGTTPVQLDGWLSVLESSSGCDSVNILIEACHSGSFIDRAGNIEQSISKPGRVVIASTGRLNNAYASAQGAYFSDAFFSAVAEGNDLRTCFNVAKAAVETSGLNQTPWLDDNGDAQFSSSDGAHAANRRIASFFGAILADVVEASVAVEGERGTITARVERGEDPVQIVWAAIYGPAFQEPDYTTLESGVPLVKLLEQGEEGTYAQSYDGFAAVGQYRIVVYAQDTTGNQAVPEVAMVTVGAPEVYLPLITKRP